MRQNLLQFKHFQKFNISLFIIFLTISKFSNSIIAQDIKWSNWMDLSVAANNTFDEYTFGVAANKNGSYVIGNTNQIVLPGNTAHTYLGGTAAEGFDNTVSAGESLIIRYTNDGLGIDAYTGTNFTFSSANSPVDIELFPDGRVLVLFNNGQIQIYSADLKTQVYSGTPAIVGTHSAYSVAIKDNNTFYISQVLANGVNVPAGTPSGPDPNRRTSNASDGLIMSYNVSGSAVSANWYTYVGGGSAGGFGSVAVSPDKTKLCFGFYSEGGATGPITTGMHDLVNPIDATAANSEYIVGVLDITTAAVPSNFDVLSWLGGSGNEKIGAGNNPNSQGIQVVALNDYFYVGATTVSTDMPGLSGTPQTTLAGLGDAFLSRIPMTGSMNGGVVKTTYMGGAGEDIFGGIAANTKTGTIAFFGTTQSSDFPVNNSFPPINFYDGTYSPPASSNLNEMYYTLFSDDLSKRTFSSYIGGSFDDYLGVTGILAGTGHLYYSEDLGRFYLSTTSHSFSEPSTGAGSGLSLGVIGTAAQSPVGYDRVRATNGQDVWLTMTFDSEPKADYSDAPIEYAYPAGSELADYAASAVDVTPALIRIGATVDAEISNINNSATALGDDNNNTGSADDEDGVASFPTITTSHSTYTISVSVYNNTGTAKTLQGWIDFNRNGSFDDGEYATVAVPASTAQQNVALAWSGLTAGVAGDTYLRLRLNDTPIKAATDDLGLLGFGEVEDYKITILPISVTGNVFNDPNAGNVGNSTGVANLIPSGLFAYLIKDGIIVGTATVATDGIYTFNNVPGGTGFTVLISTKTATGTTPPDVLLPTGWANTGDYNGLPDTGTNAASVNGISEPFTVGTSNITDINFAIEALPTPVDGSTTVVANPGGDKQSDNTASAFSGTDLSNGTISSLTITAFPMGATSIVVNGTTYFASDNIWPANGGSGIVIPTTDAGVPKQTITVDPTETGSTSVIIPFKVTDNAGQTSTTTANVTVPFSTALPIDLISFTGNRIAERVVLNWKVAHEQEFSHFEIQKSTDTIEFGNIGNLPGNGNHFYSHIDNSPNNGNNYYRLKMVDLNGTYKYSKIVALKFEDDATLNIENPIYNGTINVFTNNINPKFELFNYMGQKIEIMIGQTNKNNFVINTNAKTGIYYLRLISNSAITTKKVVIK